MGIISEQQSWWQRVTGSEWEDSLKTFHCCRSGHYERKDRSLDEVSRGPDTCGTGI